MPCAHTSSAPLVSGYGVGVMPGVHFHWLQIQRYRNVAPGTRLVFSRGLNVVLGRNGAGKTTLLRLLAVLLTGKLDRLKDEPFELSYGLTAGEIDLAVELRNDPEAGDWSSEIALRRQGDGDLLGRVTTSSSVAHVYAGDGDVASSSVSSSPFDGNSLYERLEELSDILDDDDSDDSDDDDSDDDSDDDDDSGDDSGVAAAIRAAEQTLRGFTDNGGLFDAGLTVFGAITGGGIPEGVGDVDWAYLTVEVKDRKVSPSYATFIPAELEEAIRRRRPEDVHAGELRLSTRELPFLEKARAAIGAAEASLILPVSERPPADGDASCTYHDFTFHFVTAGGAVLAHDHLGDSEKRMIALLYHAAANLDVIVADDLLSGFGHAWARTALAEIQGRQSFISTRDPLAFAFLRPGFDDALIACAPGARLSWKKLDAVDAASIRRSAGEGLHRVGEALLALDLW